VACSQVAGQIGTVKARVLLWDHDPFMARPNQMVSFPITRQVQGQFQGKKGKADLSGLQFFSDSAALEPSLKKRDMFVYTVNEVAEGATLLDFVHESPAVSSSLANRKSLGGDLYSGVFENPVDALLAETMEKPEILKGMFPHRTWRYIGSLLDANVYLHPSQYADPGNLIVENSQNDKLTLDKIKDSPKWSMVDDKKDQVALPAMVNKQTPRLGSAVHWTLEKHTPMFQGEDFFVTIKKGDKSLDFTSDPLIEALKNLEEASDEKKLKVIEEFATESNIPDYQYLMPYVKGKDEKEDGQNTVPGEEFINGISNEAYSLEDGNGSYDEAVSILSYNWQHKSYIMFEIGSDHTDEQGNADRYFIELVKGRNPRFIHLGHAIDLSDYKIDGKVKKNSQKIKKSRVLSEFTPILSDVLFEQDEFSFQVKNHLGRIIIIFSGYERLPWTIRRLDPVFLSSSEASQDVDPNKTAGFTENIVPLIVPAAKCRIHGGNISCVISVNPMQYVESGHLIYRGMQADTKEANAGDIFATFSILGESEKEALNSTAIKGIFSNSRLRHQKFGYHADAKIVRDIVRNQKKPINIYKVYNNKFKRIGKGYWAFQEDDRVRVKSIIEEPHELSISNAKLSPGTSKFVSFGVNDPSYQYADYISAFDVKIGFKAGSVKLPIDKTFDATVTEKNSITIIHRCLTPIATSWRYIIMGGSKPFANSVDSIDISPLVSQITDKWSAEEFYMLRHEANLTCYAPVGVPPDISEDLLDVDTFTQEKPVSGKQLFNLGRKLLSLKDKAIYVSIAYWWDNGIGVSRSPDSPEFGENDIQMTGVSYGATVEKRANQIQINLKVKDYMTVFEHNYMFNSPFFDAVNSSLAIYEIAKMAQFDDSTSFGSFPSNRLAVDRRPLGFLQKAMDTQNRVAFGAGDPLMVWNGQKYNVDPFALPGSYADVAQPAVRFNNGERFDEALKKIAKLATKTIYFDRWGVLIFEVNPVIEAGFQQAGESLTRFTPKFYFFSSPREQQLPENAKQLEGVVRFNPNTDGASLVYDVVTYSRDVEAAINQISIVSATRDELLPSGERVGGFIVEGFTFFDQIWNPEAEGFLGFRKTFYQSEGIFGSSQGAKESLKHYAKMSIPPIDISFSTYGVGGLKSLDIIALDNNPLYILEISHTIDASSNSWSMEISGEWFKPFVDDLGLLPTPDPVPIP